MLEVLDKNNIRLCFLENAFNVIEDEKINAISSLLFTLPYSDPKNDYCQPFNRVRLNNGQLYRILPQTLNKEEDGTRQYECEHVIATLLDRVLFGYHVIGNIGVYTAEVIRYVLSKQADWVLSECDFKRQFEYGWEQENLLGALFSIPKPFAQDYIWKYDTSVYPWRLSLKLLDKNKTPNLYIRNKKNLLRLEKQSNPSNICTRLYPLGYGEGVNQLGIKEINKGLPYIQSPQSYIDKYGIIERIWVDRRYTNQESLLDAAQAMLDELQEPTQTYRVDFTELNASIYEKATVGDVVEIRDTDTDEVYKTFITGVKREYSETPSGEITIANRSTNIAETIADLADRQRIEMTYAQGATQLYAQSLQANANPSSPATINFYMPAEMRIINKVMAKIKLESFRAYSKATQGGGAYSSTSESGGAYSSTSDSGGSYGSTSASNGSYSSTSESGGGESVTSSNERSDSYSLPASYTTTVDGYYGSTDTQGDHNHGINNGQRLAIDVFEGGASYTYFYQSGKHYHNFSIPGHTHLIKSDAHNHRVDTPAHRHSFSIPSHTHDFSIPSHRHGFSISSHRHNFSLPSHVHDIEPGIYRFGNPKGFYLLVNGKQKKYIADTSVDIDLTDYLTDDGKIPRGIWHSVAIKPTDLAYISIDIYVQGFIQSRGDKTL